jgi:hypothetical protein
MGLETVADGADRFMAFVEELTSVIGYADRAVLLRDYCIGFSRRRAARALSRWRR